MVTRDPNANGHFIYSVNSTKIYCRPTCPGRLARRANVGFYETPFQAEAAGFRACKRCKPDTVLEDPQEQAVKKACQLIDEALLHGDSKLFKLQELAKKVGLTPRYFHKIFKDKTGMTPKEFAKSRSTAHGSPSNTPASSTTEASVQSWDWDTFDFNDLVDYSTYSTQALAIDFATNVGHVPVTEFGAEFDATTSFRPWSTGYEVCDAGFVVANNLSVDPFLNMSTPMDVHEQKFMSTVSTFDLDEAVILGSESTTDIFLI